VRQSTHHCLPTNLKCHVHLRHAANFFPHGRCAVVRFRWRHDLPKTQHSFFEWRCRQCQSAWQCNSLFWWYFDDGFGFRWFPFLFLCHSVSPFQKTSIYGSRKIITNFASTLLLQRTSVLPRLTPIACISKPLTPALSRCLDHYRPALGCRWATVLGCWENEFSFFHPPNKNSRCWKVSSSGCEECRQVARRRVLFSCCPRHGAGLGIRQGTDSVVVCYLGSSVIWA
jgi:hypothetical protein